MSDQPFTTYLELRESTAEGAAGAGLSHRAGGLFLLHVQELAARGEPRGTIALVHDAGDHGGRYLGAARELAERGWAVSLPDLRGHGKSEGERGHSAGLDEVLRDLVAIQDHLAYMAPEVPRVLVGTGLGGLYGLALALERPDALRALVLCAPLLEPRFHLPEPKTGLRKLFAKVGPTTPGETGFEPAALTGDEGEARAWREDELVHRKITLRAGTQALEMARRCAPRIAELSLPILVLQGTADPIADPARARALSAPNLELRLFEGLRHDLLHEARRDEVMQALEEWLERVA